MSGKWDERENRWDEEERHKDEAYKGHGHGHYTPSGSGGEGNNGNGKWAPDTMTYNPQKITTTRKFIPSPRLRDFMKERI